MATVKKTIEQVDQEITTAENVKYDEKVIKKIIVASLMGVDGFLGTAGGLFHGKSASEEEEVFKHIGISTKKAGEVTVNVKAIAESGKNIPTIVDEMTKSVIRGLHAVAGLDTKAVNIEIADTMSVADFDAKYIKAPKASK